MRAYDFKRRMKPLFEECGGLGKEDYSIVLCFTPECVDFVFESEHKRVHLLYAGERGLGLKKQKHLVSFLQIRGRFVPIWFCDFIDVPAGWCVAS